MWFAGSCSRAGSTGTCKASPSRAWTAAARLSARKSARRLKLAAQRDDLCIRGNSCRLRRVGGAGARRVGRRRLPIAQAGRGQRAGRELSPRSRRAALGQRQPLAAPTRRCLHRGCDEPGIEPNSNHKTGPRRTASAAFSSRSARQALQHCRRLSAPGHGTRQHRRAHRHAPQRGLDDGERAVGVEILRGNKLDRCEPTAKCWSRRRLSLAAPAPALGYRPGRRLPAVRHRTPRRPPGGPRPSGPPPAVGRVAQQRGEPAGCADARERSPVRTRGPGSAELERGRGWSVGPHAWWTRGTGCPTHLRCVDAARGVPRAAPRRGLLLRSVARQANEPRPGDPAVGASACQAADPPQLPDDRGRPAQHDRRRAAHARRRGATGACARTTRGVHRPGVGLRGRHPRFCAALRPHRVSPCRHVRHGPRRRPRAAGAWSRRAPSRRCLGDAHDPARQHQCTHDHDRGEGRRLIRGMPPLPRATA